MREHDAIRLRHMIDAAREAVSFAQGRSRGDLEMDRMLVLSLVKAIEIVGEAAFQISKPTRDELPSIPWEDIISMRHRLVHAYFDINIDILWQTVQSDLPTLIAQIESLLPLDRV
jgi:uncharacterized protein with HEPN domain